MTVVIRKPAERDLMHFTRYAIEFTRCGVADSAHSAGSKLLKERKDWAADHLFVEDESQCILVAEEGGKVVGYVYGVVTKQGALRIGRMEEIFVDEFYRREGIGTKLVKGLTQWLDSRQVDRFEAASPPGVGKAEGFIHSLELSTDNKDPLV
ncbi:GNAT family N-acetyltransferase [Halobacillus sp. A5]|uniref:GNAT family N-acetyltransferase n=1 Tax=Halobacillus sp. A5 TaxID=2880263 RepID=UPI0020A66D94|nr:GNAT family N-acetyltransferase [Halobacillus sp. A5]MCP3029286.1 GNAT family N-acetyltransferase [Halobacillus sp. A5]